jgi:hypothetical protein
MEPIGAVMMRANAEQEQIRLQKQAQVFQQAALRQGKIDETAMNLVSNTQSVLAQSASVIGTLQKQLEDPMLTPDKRSQVTLHLEKVRGDIKAFGDTLSNDRNVQKLIEKTSLPMESFTGLRDTWLSLLGEGGAGADAIAKMFTDNKDELSPEERARQTAFGSIKGQAQAREQGLMPEGTETSDFAKAQQTALGKGVAEAQLSEVEEARMQEINTPSVLAVKNAFDKSALAVATDKDGKVNSAVYNALKSSYDETVKSIETYKIRSKEEWAKSLPLVKSVLDELQSKGPTGFWTGAPKAMSDTNKKQLNSVLERLPAGHPLKGVLLKTLDDPKMRQRFIDIVLPAVSMELSELTAQPGPTWTMPTGGNPLLNAVQGVTK